MAVRGDNAKLQALIRKFETKGAIESVKKVLAVQAKTLVAEGFKRSQAPDGSPWAPPMRRSGKPLLDTGRLRNSFATEITPGGFRLGTNVAYARYHQTGTRRMVSRKMVPEGRLPPGWVLRFNAAATAALKAYYGA